MGYTITFVDGLHVFMAWTLRYITLLILRLTGVCFYTSFCFIYLVISSFFVAIELLEFLCIFLRLQRRNHVHEKSFEKLIASILTFQFSHIQSSSRPPQAPSGGVWNGSLKLFSFTLILFSLKIVLFKKKSSYPLEHFKTNFDEKPFKVFSIY